MAKNHSQQNSKNAPHTLTGASYFEQVLDEIRSSSNNETEKIRNDQSLNKHKQPSVPIDTLLQQQRVRAHSLNNDKKESEIDLISKNQKLKKLTLILLFILLFAESITLFVLAFFQGFKTHNFELDTWTLRIVVVATLVQISAMLTIAVRHLFPSAKS